MQARQKHSKNDLWNSKGFTLLELIVVVLIITMLAGLLFPVLAQAKNAAKSAQCLSNLKQCILATLMYMSDYDDTVYTTISYTDGNSVTHQWAYGFDQDTSEVIFSEGFIAPYVVTPIFACPSAQGMAAAGIFSSDNILAYGLNAGPYYNGHDRPNASQFEAPAETLWIADCAILGGPGSFLVNFLGFPADVPTRYYGFSPPSLDDTAALHGRHNGKANTGWMDGHAKTISVTTPSVIWPIPDVTPEDMKENNLGYLLHPNCPDESPCEDYYYTLKKPALP